MLRFEHVSLRRGTKLLLGDADFTITAGRITTILGPNGAGKSSLLMAMAGLLSASEGEIWLDKQAIGALSRAQIAARMAWQGELPAAEFGLTVRQRLELAAGESAVVPAAGKSVGKTAERMDIGALLDRDLAKLSSGERQRVELSAIMLRDCPIWLLDEPTSHLDLKHQVAMLQQLRSEANAGRLIVCVLHDLQQAMAVADDVILLDGAGGCEAGESSGLLTAERLSRLFQVKLMPSGEGALLPDYRA